MIRRSVFLAAALAVASTAAGAACAQQTPHPAVVRVIATENNGASLGSGALVAVRGARGLVLTNWHVVKDATGELIVSFPGGFRSLATVLATDQDWDLAALAIDRPPGVDPIPLAATAPQPGDVLWIAGYGRGAYRASAGRCTQYVAPGRNLPFEMVELSTAARKGDSGGPILNQRGELAGVLFGAGWGRTAGTYCGRVRWFLDAKADEFYRLAPEPPGPMIAQQAPPPPASGPGSPAASHPGWSVDLPAVSSEAANPQAATVDSAPLASIGGVRAVPDAADLAAPPSAPTVLAPQPARSEQLKTILAAIGLLAIVFHGLRLLALASR